MEIGEPVRYFDASLYREFVYIARETRVEFYFLPLYSIFYINFYILVYGSVLEPKTDRKFKHRTEYSVFHKKEPVTEPIGKKTNRNRRFGSGSVGFSVFLYTPSIFHILLRSLRDQCIALSAGAVLFNPGVLRFNRWMPGYNFISRD